MNTPFDAITEFIFVEHEPREADVILVPGGSRPELMERACALFLAGFAPLILPSGGPNPKLPTHPSECDFLLEIARRRGVPESAILREDKARNTHDNAVFSARVLREHGVFPRRAILVCKTFHARRALLSYAQEFPPEVEFLVCPIVDERNVTRRNWILSPEKTELVLGEVEKIGKYFVPHIHAWRERRQA